MNRWVVVALCSTRDGWVRNPNYATLTTDIVWLSQMLEKVRREYAMPVEIVSYPRGFQFK